jgi:ribosomal protein S18 acetylase RimI-like enzyme
MDIAPISENDLSQLAGLQTELINEESNIHRMRELLPVILKDNNYCLLGAEKEGRLVGSLVGIVCHDLVWKCVPFMVVENVIVTKELREQGIGRMLIEEIERIAKARDCRYIMLVSSAKRRKALGFYRALGYDSAQYRAFKKFLEPR